MAYRYTVDNQLVITTFAERKAERIANHGRKYKFNVVSLDYGDVVGCFDSRKEADEFAFDQVGQFVCDTPALRALMGLHRSDPISNHSRFYVSRVEA